MRSIIPLTRFPFPLPVSCRWIPGQSGSGRGSDDDTPGGKSAARSAASSISSGSGHEMPAASARRRYVLTVLSEMPTAAAISRRLRPSLCLRRRTS